MTDDKNQAGHEHETNTPQNIVELEENDLNDVSGGKYVNKASPDLM